MKLCFMFYYFVDFMPDVSMLLYLCLSMLLCLCTSMLLCLCMSMLLYLCLSMLLCLCMSMLLYLCLSMLLCLCKPNNNFVFACMSNETNKVVPLLLNLCYYIYVVIFRTYFMMFSAFEESLGRILVVNI